MANHGIRGRRETLSLKEQVMKGKQKHPSVTMSRNNSTKGIKKGGCKEEETITIKENFRLYPSSG